MLVGDLHLRAKRMVDVAAAWNRTVTWAHDNDVDLIVQAGDVFDHANVYGKEANVGTIYDMFMAPYKAQKNPIKTFVMPGNHDMGGAMDMDALAPFVGHPYILVSRKPEVVPYNDQLSICSVPWVNRAQLMAKLVKKGESAQTASDKVTHAISNLLKGLAPNVKEHKKAGKFVVFAGHIEVTGAKMAGDEVQAGGAFEFNASDLAGLGCDAYALAHIHVRQGIKGLPNPNDGYIGSLCSLDFGQEGPVGARLLEFDADGIKRDEWIDNNDSPRYFTVESLTGLDYRQGVDYVKVRGEHRPESLPRGVMFEIIPQVATTKRQTGEHLGSSTPIRKLLSAWKEFANCPVGLDAMTEAAEQLQSKSQLPADAIGSLDSIDGITLRNITCHSNTELDLNGLRGLCSFEGPNGSGKTTAIESITLGLFGTAPSREELQTLLPQDSDGVGLIELTFTSSGRKYVVRREFKKTPKTFSHKAYLFESDNYDTKNPEFDKAVAGPSPADVKGKCVGLVGDPDLVLAGVFYSQTEAGDLVDLLPSERKELFAKLLGSDKYLILSEKAKDMAKADNAIMESHAARIARLDIELADEPSDTERIQQLKSKIKENTEKASDAEKELEAAQAVLATLDAAKKERDGVLAQIAKIDSRKAEIKQEGAVLKAEKAALEDSEKQVKALEEGLESARQSKDKLDELSAKASESIEAASGIESKAAAARTQASKLRADRQSALSKEVKTRMSALQALQSNIVVARKSLEAQASSLELEVQFKRLTLEQAKKRAKLLEGFPDVSACKSCPLAKDGIEGRDSLTVITKEGKALVSDLAAAKKLLEEFDNANEEKIADAKSAIPDDESWQPEALAAADEKDAEAKALSEKAEKERFRPDPAVLAKLKEQSARAKPLEAALDAAKGARVAIAKVDAKMDALRSEFKKIDEDAKGIKVPEACAPEAAALKVSALRSTFKECQSAVSSASRELGNAEAVVAAHKKRREEVVDLKEKIVVKDKAIGVYNALTKAFSKDGIPQLIVDSAVPHYQDIMSELMTNFGGKWAIQASTQREVNKGASIKETFDIIVDDGHGGRDIKTYSGGEKRLLKNITRIAFSLLQAERSGKGLKVLALDEATENMDHGNIDSFIKMLNKLSDSFSQVFVVSHNDYVLSSMPNRILFHRTGWPNEWTTVETSFSQLEVA